MQQMNQPKPKNNALQQVFQLVDQLSVEELLELRQKLDAKTWGERFDRLVKQIAEDTKDMPPLTEEEIAQEVMDYRREKRAQGA